MISNLEFYTQPNDIEGEGFQTSTILKKKIIWWWTKLGKKKKQSQQQEMEHFSGHEHSHQNDWQR